MFLRIIVACSGCRCDATEAGGYQEGTGVGLLFSSVPCSYVPKDHYSVTYWLPLPTSQKLEAIKKVAQILVMLGEQVIPAIIGDPPSPGNCEGAVEDVPNDIVNNP
ncbi:uncharacterized protein LOC114358144 [Ostrinia furnacalis]|uniref:uncharacterized protein LOC114358144 n=1 Tax=Ostrinia furnacalis TaxID=93504 RepID=UPI00103C3F16|nr:uncharacterized protein LOC114358144 [Ostrinia furnacalis]